MKYNFKLAFAVLLTCFNTSVLAQFDPVSRQYLSNQTLFNPAYVGSNDILIGMLSTRGQWTGIDGAPFTHTLSVGSSITETMGAGLLLISDNYGINNDIEAILSYSYKINWINNSLSFGLQGGIKQHQANYNELNLESFDSNLPTGSYKHAVNNFGVGAFFKSRNYYVGLSVPRILEQNLAHDVSGEILYNRYYYLSAGYVFDYVELIKIKPSILVTAIEGESVNVELNGHIIFRDRFWAGISLNHLNAAGFDIQYVEDGMRFGYSFEVPINNLASASYGTHELMFSIDAKILKIHKRNSTLHNERYF